MENEVRRKTMKITWTTKKYEQIKADVVAVPFYQSGDNPAFEALDRKARKALSAVAKSGKVQRSRWPYRALARQNRAQKLLDTGYRHG